MRKVIKIMQIEYRQTKSFIEELQELRKDVDLYLFHRRWQGMLEGKQPWEDKLLTSATRFYVHAVVQWRRVVKRTVDLFVSTLAVSLSSPLMALIAVAIKLSSPGPVLFKQVRVGQRGKTFTMYKFRSMRRDAEVKSGPVWAKENDPRITSFGWFLRKTHLDELPQFFNVIKGEMSLVGPRPERPHFVHELRKAIPHYDRRLCVKPGITGLAQLRQGYDETIEDVKRKLRYDTLYIRKMCPILDFKVLSMTFGAVIFGTGH